MFEPSEKGGQMSDSLGHGLLLLGDMENYVNSWDDDLVLKLKWHTIAVSFDSLETVSI